MNSIVNSMSKTVEKINESSSDMMHVTEIREAVANVKSIVAYFKRTGLNNKLPVVSLKQSNETRWNFSPLISAETSAPEPPNRGGGAHKKGAPK